MKISVCESRIASYFIWSLRHNTNSTRPIVDILEVRKDIRLLLTADIEAHHRDSMLDLSLSEGYGSIIIIFS